MSKGASKKGKKTVPVTSETNSLSIVVQPADFFKQQVTKALQNQKIRADQDTEFYLVDLLTRFMVSDNLFAVDEKGAKREEVLALLLGDALSAADAASKQRCLRRVGDVSLYTAGFFSDRLARKVVDVDYYIGMGRNAYSSLSHMGVDAFFGKVFGELSDQFHKFVDVLAEVSEATGCANNDSKNILRLYDIWLKTKSERAEKSLKEAGIIPNPLVKPRFQ